MKSTFGARVTASEVRASATQPPSHLSFYMAGSLKHLNARELKELEFRIARARLANRVKVNRHHRILPDWVIKQRSEQKESL